MTWYALITNPKCERRADAGLRAANIATFLPQGAIWTKPRRAPDLVCRNRLVMPRYLFISFDGAPRWDVVRRTDGIAGVVGAAGRPLPIAPAPLESLFQRQFVGALNFNAPPRRKRGWKPGHYDRGVKLEIRGGPLEGFIGTVVRPSGKVEVDVEVLLFGGRGTVTRVSLDDVKVAA